MRDECFIRGTVPMTKSEIRAIVLSKLAIKKDSIIYDVGAGTGSVSIEAAMVAESGHVYAFEQKEEGCELIRKNQEVFGQTNVTVIPGQAPETIVNLPVADCAFIGGSGGNLEAILDRLLAMNDQMRIVVTAITIETLGQIMDYAKRIERETEVVCVQVSYAMPAGRYHMMKAQNPIHIISL